MKVTAFTSPSCRSVAFCIAFPAVENPAVGPILACRLKPVQELPGSELEGLTGSGSGVIG